MDLLGFILAIFFVHFIMKLNTKTFLCLHLLLWVKRCLTVRFKYYDLFCFIFLRNFRISQQNITNECTRAFFIRKFVQSKNVTRKKAFVRKIRAFNIDEIDHCSTFSSQIPIIKKILCSVTFRLQSYNLIF